MCWVVTGSQSFASSGRWMTHGHREAGVLPPSAGGDGARLTDMPVVTASGQSQAWLGTVGLEQFA